MRINKIIVKLKNVPAMLVMALAMSGWLPLGRIFGDYYNPDGIISKGFRKLSQIKSTATYFPIGLLLGLLPCGPVYTALLAAAGAGLNAAGTLEGIIKGMAVMMYFGIGTVPALFIVAKLVDMGLLKKRQIIYRIGTILMILVGLFFIAQGIWY